MDNETPEAHDRRQREAMAGIGKPAPTITASLQSPERLEIHQSAPISISGCGKTPTTAQKLARRVEGLPQEERQEQTSG
jgi:hypothetical protein